MLKNHITINLKCFTLTVVYLIKLFNVSWLIRHIEWHFLWIDKQDYFLGIVNNTEKHQIWTFYLNGRPAWIGAVIRNIIRLISGGCQAWQPTNVSMWSKSFGITNGIPKIWSWSVNLLHRRWLKIKKLQINRTIFDNSESKHTIYKQANEQWEQTLPWAKLVQPHRTLSIDQFSLQLEQASIAWRFSIGL